LKKRKTKKKQEIKRYQQRCSAPKGKEKGTLENTSPRKTRPMVSSKKKKAGKETTKKEALSDGG
jgi:hypothetical protein